MQDCRSGREIPGRSAIIRGVTDYVSQSRSISNVPAFVFSGSKKQERENNMSQPNTKRRFIPNTYVIIFIMIVLSAVLTWIIPSGVFERTVNDAGRTVVVPGSYHRVDASPVGPIGVFFAIQQGLLQTADIIFFVVLAYGFIYVLIKNGTFDAMMGAALRKMKNFNVQYFFVVIMLLFGILGSTMGMSEETYGMWAVFMGIGSALGYDPIVGVSLVYIGVSTGFASATLNPFTIGVAQGISEITMSTGMFIFRIIAFLIFEGIAIAYVWRYATKIKNDPTKSILWGTPYYRLHMDKSQDEMMETELTLRHKLCGIIFLVVMILMVWGTIIKGWYIDELSTLFLIGMVVAGITGGYNPNQIAEAFIEAAKAMMFGALIIGVSRGILVVLQNGQIIDTILNTLANALTHFSGMFSAIAMLVVQNILNFFIPSGSGQASVSMPIMAPLADLVGVSRQTACLAFTFGDGYSNMFWPTSVATACGIMGLPVSKWYKWIAPLFGIFFATEVVLVIISQLIGL